MITSPKNIHFVLLTEITKSLKHKTKFTIGCYESLAENTIKKMRSAIYCSNISRKTIFIKMKNTSLILLMKKN